MGDDYRDFKGGREQHYTIARLNAYGRKYVTRRNGAAGGSNAGGGSSGRS